MYKTFRWYYKERNIMILLVVFPPVGLYLMYKYTKWEKNGKYLITAAHAILFIFFTTLAVLWFITTDYFDEPVPETPNIYECDIDERPSCLILEIREDFDSDVDVDNTKITLHRSTPNPFPEKTIEFEIVYNLDTPNKTPLEIIANDIITDITYAELQRLEYKTVVITIKGTFYEDGIPSTETLVVYNFSVENLITSNMETATVDEMENYESYLNPYLK